MEPSSPSTKKHFWLIIVIVLFLVCAVYVTFFKNTPNDKTLNIPPLSVEVITVSQQTIPMNFNAVGSLTALKQVDISPQVAGQVSKIGFADGQEVPEGTLLFQLDDADARAQLASALAQLRWSQVDYKRKLNLLKHAAVAQQDVDLAKATLLQNEAMVAQKQVQVQDMHLTAPFSGKVSNALVSAGQYVSVGQILVTLVGLDHLRVVFSVPETYKQQLALGQTVQVMSEALPGKTFSGIVLYIAPLVDVATRMIQVQADIPNPTRQLLPGMFVKAMLNLGDRPHVVVIPDEALIASVEGNNVFLVRDNRAVQTSVQVGQRWNNQAEILSGLKVGDVIVTVGQQKLRDGGVVKIVKTGKVLQ